MDWLEPLAFSALPMAGSALFSLIKRPSEDDFDKFYNRLNLAPWTPPNWVFGPVWTALYVSSGYASYLVWRDGGGFDGVGRTAMIVYGVSLGANWTFSPLFFGYHRLGLSFANILALWGAVAGSAYTFYPINRTACYLMLPYLAWVSYASTLSFYIWQNNPSDPSKNE